MLFMFIVLFINFFANFGSVTLKKNIYKTDKTL